MKQRSKKSLKLTDAVVRGAKNSYEFEVFPIQTEFEPQSAVYIFSKRKVDKKGRGHQKFVSIGQTPSLDGEFSKYKKSFASKYNANVICVYIEENENSRLKIEDELKTAYSISCANNLSEKKIRVKPVKAVAPQTLEIVQQKKVSEPKKKAEKVVEKAVKTLKKAKGEKNPLVSKTSKSKTKKVSSEVENKTVMPAKTPGKKLKAESAKPASRVQKQSKPKSKVRSKSTKPIPKKTVKEVKSNGKPNGKNIKSSVNTVKINGKSNGKTLKTNGSTNGKPEAASNKKPSTKSRATGSKNRATKPSSRKQLAF